MRFGLYGIKNVGDGAVEHILKVREQGKFKDLYDFCKRVDFSAVNKRALEHLVKAGAFDKLGDRSKVLANLEAAVKWGTAQRESASAGQFGLFGAEETKPPEAKARKLNRLELLKFEKDALGLYISDHPMNAYPGLSEAASCTVAGLGRCYQSLVDAARGDPRQHIVLAGLVQKVQKKATRSGGMMAFFELADETGSKEVVAFGRTYEDIADKLEEDAPVVLVAEASDKDGSTRLVVDRLIRWDERDTLPEVAIAEFQLEEVDETMLTNFRSHVDEYAGTTSLHLKVRSEKGTATYQTDALRVAKEHLDDLRKSCPWLKLSVTLDRSNLLRAAASRGNRFGRPTQEASVRPAEVPF